MNEIERFKELVENSDNIVFFGGAVDEHCQQMRAAALKCRAVSRILEV